jgi:hypothetical protein
MWLPVNIIGPCSGIFCFPNTSIDEKNIDRMEWKNTFIEKYVKSFALATTMPKKVKINAQVAHLKI